VERDMSTTGLPIFDETIHKTNSWLKQISEALGSDRHRAYQALRAVLHCLRDRLIVEQAAHLGGQLPMLVRGIYYDSWHPSGKPDNIHSREAFFAQIAGFATEGSIDPEKASRAVFQVLEEHVSRGEILDVIAELPEEIRTLWPPLPA
jgi:uncharacterized protein (DUF2267 family)